MNQTVYEKEEMKYVMVFHGRVPGILMARVAYRRVDRQEPRALHARKIINCPYCTKPLTDVDKETRVDLYCYPVRKQVRCQVYPVCPHCGNEVGMIIAS